MAFGEYHRGEEPRFGSRLLDEPHLGAVQVGEVVEIFLGERAGCSLRAQAADVGRKATPQGARSFS
jgi:hypothetical protein